MDIFRISESGEPSTDYDNFQKALEHFRASVADQVDYVELWVIDGNSASMRCSYNSRP